MELNVGNILKVKWQTGILNVEKKRKYKRIKWDSDNKNNEISVYII